MGIGSIGLEVKENPVSGVLSVIDLIDEIERSLSALGIDFNKHDIIKHRLFLYIEGSDGLLQKIETNQSICEGVRGILISSPLAGG